MGLVADFNANANYGVAKQNQQFSFVVEARNEFDNAANLNLFSDAEYIIYKDKQILVSTKHSDGTYLRKDQNYYQVTIPASLMNMSGTVWHRFTLFNSEGGVLTPVFHEALYVTPEFK